MRSFKAFSAIFLLATLCTAQTINIRGIVKDRAGVGISGATVKLEAADISTTTGADGSFTLTNGSAQIRQIVKNRTIAASPVQIQNGKITIHLSENTPVVISIHDVGGRQVYSKNQTYSSGTHALQATLQSDGIFIYRVTIGKESYSFKSSFLGSFSTERPTVLCGASMLAKQAKTTAIISDVMSIVKEGQLNYRYSIETPDASDIIVKMIPNAGNVTDIDGNVYQSVQIGNQVWTVENLKTTKYNDGTAITQVTDAEKWSLLSTGACCFYDNNAAVNKAKYGALYNWYAVNTGKLAPEGWRVSTEADWVTLQNYLIANGFNWDETKTGNKIAKSIASQTDWYSSTYAGVPGNDLSRNNTSGFSALPGGYRNVDGGFYFLSKNVYWWSATESDATHAFNRFLYYSTEYLVRPNELKHYGFYVRLLRG